MWKQCPIYLNYAVANQSLTKFLTRNVERLRNYEVSPGKLHSNFECIKFSWITCGTSMYGDVRHRSMKRVAAGVDERSTAI